MLARDIPLEIQWKVLDHLRTAGQIQYSLVSKHWRRAARHVLFHTIHLRSAKRENEFVATLARSPCLQQLVKELVLYDSTGIKETQHYINLIHLTPNLRLLETKRNYDSLYQAALQEVQHGQWKNLHCIKPSMRSNTSFSVGAIGLEASCPQYYALLTVLQDRLSSISLDISHMTHSLFELYCFQFPSYVTRQIRFISVKELECVSSGMTAVRSLDEVLALCPNATEVTLKLNRLDRYEDQLISIKPNMTVKRLSILLFISTEAGLDYISCKFPNAMQLVIMVNLLGEITAKFLHYVLSMEKSNVSFREGKNLNQFFDELSSFSLEGNMQIKLGPNLLHLQHDRFKPCYSKLSLKSKMHGLDLTQDSLKVYLSQLNELNIGPIEEERNQLLIFCSQLQTLCICYEDTITYNGPILPITCLIIESEDDNMKFLKDFTVFTPNLKEIKVNLSSNNICHIDVPCASLHSLDIHFRRTRETSLVFLSIARPGIESYFQVIKNQIIEIDVTDYKKKQLQEIYLEAKINCKDIKHIKIQWESCRNAPPTCTSRLELAMCGLWGCPLDGHADNYGILRSELVETSREIYSLSYMLAIGNIHIGLTLCIESQLDNSYTDSIIIGMAIKRTSP
ncbi:hypothetical protein EDC96DRAFT_549585 [Choanephora cucurbitarum]|nr:hypothetical protein EDC96DRAFT_549585 [Choanephora cucurbitarum]